MRLGQHGAAVLAALAFDTAFADPQRWHPVAGNGRMASAVERAVYRDHRAAGAGAIRRCSSRAWPCCAG